MLEIEFSSKDEIYMSYVSLCSYKEGRNVIK